MLTSLIKKNRSYRRFYESEKITTSQLREWLDNARLGASGRNAQTLKYLIVTSDEKKEQLFKNLAWAGYLTNWEGPEKGERPAAYVIMLNDNTLGENYFCDDGIAVQNLLLSAVEAGFGGCIIRAFNNEALRRLFNIPNHMDIIQVIALGRPKEEVLIESMKNGDIKYWRDENGVHHVPKRELNELIIGEL